MTRVNDNYLKLKAGYLFPEIGRRVRDFAAANPSRQGHPPRHRRRHPPAGPGRAEGLPRRRRRPGTTDNFAGYGPEQGYDWLINAIIEKSYKPLGVRLKTEEMFISDGSKCDCANILDIFALDNVVAIGDPVYPVYNDTNVMIGRTGEADDKGYYEGIVYMPCNEANGFIPALPTEKVDIIYLCFPNNPTGTVATQGRAEEVGRLRHRQRRGDLLRRRLRGVHHRPGYPPLHLRDRRGEEVRHRVPLLLQDRRLHRRPLRPGGRAGRGDGEHPDGREVQLQQALAAPHHHQVQRRLLPGPERRRRGLLRRGVEADQGDHRLLHGERPHHP